MSSSIPVSFGEPKHRGECGVHSNTTPKLLVFPWFRMGCCGDKDAVVQVQMLTAPTQINKEFFAIIASHLKKTPFFDWDWGSFRRNILLPNREHITEIFGEFFARRIIEDLYVVLNNWDKHSEEEELQSIEEGYIPVSHRTFFTNKRVEY